MKRTSIVIYGLLAVALTFVAGCPDAPFAIKIPNSIPATGSSISRADALVTSADAAVKAAVPHSDVAGKQALSLAVNDHHLAQASLADAQKELGESQSQRDQIERQASSQAAADAAKVANLQEQVAALNRSLGHRVEVGLRWAIWIIVALVVIHFAGAAAAAFVPPPYNLIAGTIGKIVNPFGWVTWLISAIQQQRQAAAAVK